MMRFDTCSGMDVRSVRTSAASPKSEASSTNVAVATPSPSANQVVLGSVVVLVLRDDRSVRDVRAVGVDRPGLPGVVTAPDLVETI